MIQAIIFDCFGVLTTDTWRAFLDSLPPGVDTTLPRELNRQYDSGLIAEDEFLEQVHAATGKHLQQVEKMPGNEVLKNTKLLDYIALLKSNYKIGLLSNIGTNWIVDSFLSTPEQKLFDDMVFSHAVGMVKPNPEIFKLACERLEVEPNSTIMIDDVASYCDAATAVGMQAVVYQDFEQFKRELERILHHA